MKGEHKPGYRRPRTGEKRRTRQPLKVDKLPQEVREAIQKARAAGATWAETAEAAAKVAARLKISFPSEDAVRRWYDLRIEQVNREVEELDVRAEKNLKKFFGQSLKELPAAAAHALKREVFGMQAAKTSEQREASIGSFLVVLSKIIDAQAKQKRAEIEERKVNLAQKKFDELKAKAEKELNALGQKIEKGKQPTAADIDRIRERALGLPPRKREVAAHS